MKKHNRKIIYLAGFLFYTPIALTFYINSSFLGTYVNESQVSLIYAVASAIAILGLIYMPKIITRLGNRNANLLLSATICLMLILLAFSKTSFVAIGAFIVYFISIILIITTFDIFMEDFSTSASVGRFRGFYLTVTSSAWVIALLLSSSIIERTSFKGIYLLAALFMVLVFIVFSFSLHHFRDPEYKRVSAFEIFQLFMQNKNISKIYFIALILRFFYSWMVIYTPIYLNQHIGFGWGQIGIIFSIMILPFVILAFPLGKLSDKIGEKKMLITGFIIISIFTFIIPFVNEPRLWVWAAVLFFARVGAATIEVMSESYFFKNIKEENSNMLSFFRNAIPLAYIIGPLVGILVLSLVPAFEYLYFVLSALLVVGLFISLRLKDVK